MKVVVIGSGSIGMLTAFYLAKNNMNPILVTNRKEQTVNINEHCLQLVQQDSKRKKIHINSQPLSALTNLGPIDVAIIAVKSHQVNDLLKTIQQVKINAILFLQNGMGHTNLFPSIHINEIGAAVVEHGALRMNDYTVKHTGVGGLKWSYIRQGDKRIESLFEKWDEPLFKVNYEQNWRHMLQSKLVVNACINPLTALLGVKNGQLIENEYYCRMLRAVFDEVNVVLQLKDKEEAWEQVYKICRNTAQNRSSMLVDVESHRETEIDSILSYLIDIANKQKKNVPILTFLYNSIKGKTI